MAKLRKKMSVAAKRQQYETALRVHRAIIKQKQATIARFKDLQWIAEQISAAEAKILEQEQKIEETNELLEALPQKGKTYPQHLKQTA